MIQTTSSKTGTFMVQGKIYEADYSIEDKVGMKAWDAFFEMYGLKEINSDGSKEDVDPQDKDWIADEIMEQCRVHNFTKIGTDSEEYKSEQRGDEHEGTEIWVAKQDV